MSLQRRQVIAAGAALAALGEPAAATPETPQMYGLIGKMTAKPGQRDALAAILIAEVAAMPGCLSYIVALDPKDADAIWITEAWDSQASHDNSLKLASVQAAIAKARPMIAGMEAGTVTTPVGGWGLVTPKT
jgi:quinol monooxygenase YgiN